MNYLTKLTFLATQVVVTLEQAEVLVDCDQCRFVGKDGIVHVCMQKLGRCWDPFAKKNLLLQQIYSKSMQW